MHCGPPNHNFGWTMAHPAYTAVCSASVELKCENHQSEKEQIILGTVTSVYVGTEMTYSLVQ